MGAIGVCPECRRTGPIPCPVDHPVSQKWADGYDLAASFRCLRSFDPGRWQEVHQSCRSRRFRKWWLSKIRDNPAFTLAKLMRAI